MGVASSLEAPTGARCCSWCGRRSEELCVVVRGCPAFGGAARLGALFGEQRSRGWWDAVHCRCRCCGGLGFVTTQACLTAPAPPVPARGLDHGHERRPPLGPSGWHAMSAMVACMSRRCAVFVGAPEL